jgi:hypothetical protein
MRTVMLFIVSLVLTAVPAFAQQVTMDKFLDAICKVESRGNVSAIGDNGRAIGPYQIWREYWQDAVKFDKSLAGCYEDCKNPVYARRVVRAYMARYAPPGASWEVMARIHNGGPQGHRRATTAKYWAKVQAALKEVCK